MMQATNINLPTTVQQNHFRRHRYDFLNENDAHSGHRVRLAVIITGIEVDLGGSTVAKR